MKKLNKLCAILFAVLGVQTLSAQTDVTSTYLTNADFASVDGWTAYVSGKYRDYGNLNIGEKLAGYAASTSDGTHLNTEYCLGFQCRWSPNYASYNQEISELPAGVYTLSYDVENVNGSTTAAAYNNLFYVKVGDRTFTDTSTEWMKGKSSWTTHSITFVITEPTQATISLGYGTGSNNFETKNTPVLYVSHLNLTHRNFDDISAENPADFTSLIENPSFETGNSNGWTYTGSSDTGVKPNSNNTYKTTGVDGNYLYNTWWQGTPLTQTVANLPNGIYELKVLLASDQNAKLFLLANNEHSTVYTITTDNKTFHDVSYEFKVLNGQAKIGVVGGNDAGEYVPAGHWWYKADNFRLIYKGADLSIEREALNAALEKARTIDQATIPTIVAVSLNSAISTAENVDNEYYSIKAATNALLAALATVDVVQVPYKETKALITSSNNMLTNSTASDADKATFQGVINKAEEDLNNATDRATIDAIAVTIMDAQKAYCIVATPAEGHPFDMTFLVVNPWLDEGTNGWTFNTGAPNNGIATNQGGAITGNYFENWKWESYTGDIYQVLTGLPKGKYVLTAAAFRDQLIDGASDGDAVYVFANEAETLVDAATPAFYSVEVTTTTGTLTFGVRSKVAKYRWMGIDNVTLQFVAGLDLSEFTAAYSAALEAAIAARDNAEYEKVGGAEKAALLAAIAMTPEQTQESLNNATDALVSATSAFIAAKGDYDKLSAEILVAEGLGMADDQITSVTSGKTGSVAYNDLKVAEYEFIMDSYSESVQLGNWTSTFDNIGGESYDGSETKYYDKWGSGTFDLKQSVTLPAGDYAVSVIARGQSGASGSLCYKISDATTSTSLIMKGNSGLGVDVNGVANFSAGGSYSNNNAGRGWEYRFITFHLDTETTVEIGVTATVSSQWASIYAPMLYTTEASQKVLLLDEINTLLSDVPSGKMGAAVAAALESAVSVAEGVSNETELSMLSEVASDLRSAVADAKASISGYAKLEGYISMTKVFADVTQYEQKYENGEFAADEVETVRQELNVMRYNAASAVFTNKIEVTGWTGDLASGIRSDQHWSGNTQNYYDANSWTANFVGLKHTLSTTITLPNGTYVLKAAGRSSSDATLRLTIKNGDTVLESVEYTGKGDTGYGIDKSGAANFSEEGTYANNDNGRGWEWEFAKFELDAETTVTLHVEVDYNNIQNRFGSFSDITLWMDDETYVAVNGGAINAPLAAAKALVDTKPMGGAENTALQNAIAQAEGTISTPAELDGAIAALETAVANANAWVVAYNEAKAPLVAALERFETDYNKDGVKMSQTAWNNILDEVKDAAVAKDVTDNYEGFAVAAKELNAILDEADKSIEVYAALKKAIEKAEALNANVGDGAFQISQATIDGLGIADAESTYTAATAENDAVNTVIENLSEAINGIVLNAPAEGQRFYIKVATEGHGKNGNAWLMTLGNTGDNNRTGYGINANNAVQPHLNQAFIFTQVEDNLYNICIERAEGTVYLTYGALNESAAGWKNQQIQATTDAEKKGEFKIVPTGKNGILKIFNTVDNNYIDCQGGGAIYTDTNIENEEFAFELATEHEVTLNISSAGWATLILPFDAEIPEGLKAYTSVALGDESVELIQVSEGGIKANTPYLIKGTGEYTFSGYGLADKDSYEDEKGLFVGTYVAYTTTGGEYVLQKHDDKVGFYVVGKSAESAKPKVNAYRCYLTAPASEIKAFFFFDDDDVTGINGVDAEDIEIEAIYTINGTKVNSLQKGLNIVKMSNGKVKKVMVP